VTRRAPREDPPQGDARISPPPTSAAGLPALVHVSGEVTSKLGVARGVRVALRINQQDGFDCPGCAWPDPAHRHVAEFCENGIKAVAEEAMTRTVGPAFFAEHAVADLATRSDYWLGQQGRLTHPMLLDQGATHYRPVTWDEAFDVIADELHVLSSPDEAVFYTSGRTSNEAAFLYQLFARVLGTNNLPDCSNMCHESSGVALTESIGIGKGSVLLEDFEQCDLVLVVGQNPGTNHPRMLATLEAAKRRGARVVSINPLPEAGLLEFRNPQRPGTYIGRGTALADRHVRVRLGGDLALLQAVGRLLLDAEDAAPGTVIDRAFIEEHTSGFGAYAEHLRHLVWDDVLAATGLTREEIAGLADEMLASRRVIVCWAMGLTQHRDAVATIQEIVNVLLLQGNIGRPGAGVCPVRGHSNVQGDRTMGIYEKMPDSWLDRLGAEFSFSPPRAHGYDTVDAIRAMRDGAVRVFVAMGGNWIRATPDSAATEAAMRRCRLSVQVSTKLNRSHTVTGRRALILPTLGRTDRDVVDGRPQFVTVEDSMGVVHRSQGRLPPASDLLRSEIDIVCALGTRVLGDEVVDWTALAADYARIRDRISRVVPGHEDYDERVRRPNGFTLPHGPRDERRFDTATGRAQFAVSPLRVLRLPAGRLLLQTIRSHDQFNTTIYGLDDRYRGIRGGRRVVLVHPDDIDSLGLADGDRVDLVSEWDDGERRAPDFRVVAFDTARGCAAAYFPETNVLVPLDSVAERSNTPTSKAIVVRLEPVGSPEGTGAAP
jgi:molybdopterin-dependent oxidoreductase alpha subunit